MTESREQEPQPPSLPAVDVESPKVAAQEGGWVGPETAGGQGGAPPDDLDDEVARVAAVRAWARAWATRLPRWSDEQWRYVNAGLGYRVRSRAEPKKPDTRPPR